ncbi:hypothetical protein [Streptacidiphilus sp. MAP5-52]|uniref:hypothetical protein n=1 Tax=Streptacidiphilus sp. MAP5-52 TaxID=3156267 RepID=UPI0035170070
MPIPTLLRSGGRSVAARRWVGGLGVLLVVALLAGLVARLAGGGHHSSPAPVPTASASPSSTPDFSVSAPATGPAETQHVPVPPHTSDPVVFAKAFAAALWSYDTRTTSQQQEIVGLDSWLTPERAYADPAAIAAQIPDPVLWSRMRDNGQHAVGKVAEGHLPQAFSAAVAQDPTQLTIAYVYAVTVTGTQSIIWNGGGRGAQPQAVTLAVQCRPGHDCALASIAQTVYP